MEKLEFGEKIIMTLILELEREGCVRWGFCIVFEKKKLNSSSSIGQFYDLRLLFFYFLFYFLKPHF